MLDNCFYENDFDLYILLSDILKAERKQIKAKKKLETYKNYTKSLTASLLDSHSTNGTSNLVCVGQGIELYRSKVKCIGTQVKDFDFGEPIFIDIEPLSTRLKLMCKLIIIIQGACLERSGPPKLVQDRCVQFDGNSQELVNNLNNSKIKSNSLESILDNLNLPYVFYEDLDSDSKQEQVAESEIKISIFSYNNNNTENKAKACNLKRRVSSKKCNNKTTNCLSDDETSSLSSYYNIKNASTNTNVDYEHYFKHRLININKDYASIPYYQYSNIKSMKFKDKSVNTSLINVIKHQIPIKLNQSTSTDDLLSNYHLGYYSKKQLLSSQSLFEKKTSLTSSYSDIHSNTESSSGDDFPIKINIKPKLRIELPIQIEQDKFDSKLKRIVPTKSSEWKLFKYTKTLSTQ